jgi:hypothetical protein
VEQGRLRKEFHMDNVSFRLLRANEIECRVATISEKGLSLLLYKDARVDQKILDETVGPMGWKRSHQSIDGSLYCTVAIFDRESGEWISKQDVGATSFAEKEKSQASDSFKRACVNWGIGRELYSAPFIWIPAEQCSIQSKTVNGKVQYYTYDRFLVASIDYNEDREIAGLTLVNGSGKAVFERKAKSSSTASSRRSGSKATRETGQQSGITKEQMSCLQSELQRTGVEMETVQERFQIQEPETMSAETYKKVMSALAKTKSSDTAA